MTISNQPFHHWSNSRMEDRGHLDRLPDDQSWWNLKHSFSMVLQGFLMNLDEVWNTASLQYCWLIKMTISSEPFHQGSNSRMEDWGHLDGVPWWILMKFKTQLLYSVAGSSRWLSPVSLSIKDPTPGWRTGVLLMGFLVTNLAEIWNRVQRSHLEKLLRETD